MKRHPSGRPIRRNITRNLPITREPPRESLIPGLRRDVNTTAIGFHVGHVRDEDEYDEGE